MLNLTLETERLILRPLELSDASDIFKFASNPNVSKMLMWNPHQNLEESVEFIRRAHTIYQDGNITPMGITLKSSTQIIGFAGASWQSRAHKIMELETVLGEDYWGQGIVAEALMEIIKYCSKTFELNRIQARCKVENTQSFKMLQKLGMKHEGTIRSSFFAKGEAWDMEMLSLTRAELPV